MSTIQPNELAGLLQAHGLNNRDVAVGVATAIAESSLVTDAVNENDDGSRDRGVWQLNERWHPDISDEEAFDPVAATRHAVRIKGDGDWTSWNAYKNGAWRTHRFSGWLALRLHNALHATTESASELAAAQERINTLQAENTRLAAALPELREQVNNLDSARLAAIERLSNVR